MNRSGEYGRVRKGVFLAITNIDHQFAAAEHGVLAAMHSLDDKLACAHPDGEVGVFRNLDAHARALGQVGEIDSDRTLVALDFDVRFFFEIWGGVLERHAIVVFANADDGDATAGDAHFDRIGGWQAASVRDSF